MTLRPYQIDARDAALAAWAGGARAVLGVAATGLGKTRMAAAIIAAHQGRTMFLAHREELIFQTVKTLKESESIEADVEMADVWSAEHTLHGKAQCVVGTVQTQIAGRNGGRMMRFRPDEFDLLVVDEAHHAVADTWRRVIEHYQQNPRLRVFGLTATPDRADEEALGQIFDQVAFEYDMRFGIKDGWLVDVIANSVAVADLDLSHIRTTAGDLNGAELSRVLEHEKPLLGMAAPTVEIACGMPRGMIAELLNSRQADIDLRPFARRRRKTLVFAASVAHAERFCEILNRFLPDSARIVHGGTPRDERRAMLKHYKAGAFQFLVNVGVATEGFDEPGIEVIIMARPTKSRCLYAQMCGRGTRPLPGVVDDLDMFGSAAMRRAAIERSFKPHVEIVDFVGNAGRHRLIGPADILGGNISDEAADRAAAMVRKEGKRNVLKAIEQAESEIHAQREREKLAEAAQRARIVAAPTYETIEIDPFDALGIEPARERGWNKGKEITPRMRGLLEKQGVDVSRLNYAKAGQLIGELKRRWEDGRCSVKQAAILRARGLPTDVSRETAKQMIDDIASKERWSAGRRGGARPVAPRPPDAPALVRY